MNRVAGFLGAMLAALAPAAVAAATFAPAASSPEREAAGIAVPATRTLLVAGFMRGEQRLPAPLDLAAFAPSPSAQPPRAMFNGRLTFEGTARQAGFRVLRDTLGLVRGSVAPYRVLPRFDLELIQVDDRLVPARRGPQPNQRGDYEWIAQPGLVWSEVDDGGLTRAALPFALIEKNANCIHNGVLTFLFGADGTVSRVAYQVAQETCAYFQFDAWGMAVARYVPGEVANSARIAAAWQAEMQGRMPVRPIELLAAVAPGVDTAAFGAAADVSPRAMTAFGVIWRGVHYVGGCMTRHGRYPFCNELVLPSYSLAKTLVAGLASMRLELLAPGTLQSKLVDDVPECAAAGGWQDVTLGDALDMATGRYASAEREVDEDASVTSGFFVAPTHAQKIALACSRYPPRVAPGTRWVYHTTDTYVLGAALAARWRRTHGPTADFYRELLATPIWGRLGLSPDAYFTRRTLDAVAQPFTGWGLTLLRDDVAKLGTFLVAGTGTVAGATLVDPAQLQAALQRRPEDPGLPAASADLRYNNGMWAWNAAALPGCGSDTWIPFLSGFGGISVVLMPNGAVYYYFSDDREFRFARAVGAANSLKPFCTGLRHD